ncbi:MAG: serine/threonine protein kinase [Candidatus Cloacimonadota bacterium]|nr:MAG: serine/threonine protein kinase [Candidatus Cloacimonadota bacterium]PIE81635.1 MAG: serine/threonine protein kinase [Candidatus Delongbacteria bacterium]
MFERWLWIALFVVLIVMFFVSCSDDSSTGALNEITPVEMILVEGGTFQMGDHFNEGESDEKPIHDVTLRSFYIGKYEITQKEYQSVMGNNPSYFKGDNLPLESITWYDAVDYCNKLSDQEGLERCYSGYGSNFTCDFTKNGYRLPTEAEWEYAARGGVNHSDNYKYSGSNNIGKVAWYNSNSGKKTHEVGTKVPNQLGIYDMSGNVREWCNDWYSDSYYSNSPSSNPTGPSSGFRRVFRGGSWGNINYFCRLSFRENILAINSDKSLGLRLVRSTGE